MKKLEGGREKAEEFYSMLALLFGVLLPLHVNGNKILNSDGLPVTLCGVSIADPEHVDLKRPGVSLKTLLLRARDQYGVNTVRIPVHPESDGHTGFFKDPTAYLANYLLPTVEMANELGLYAIVDYHKISDWDKAKNEAFQFWEKVAPALKPYSHVLLEVFNEPIQPLSFKKFKTELMDPLVEKIRNVLPSAILLIGSPEWSTHPEGALADPIKGTNLAYVAHVYPGHEPRHLKERYEPVAKRYPLVITEWGFQKGASHPVDGTEDSFGKPFLSWLDEWSLGSVAWVFDNTWEGKVFDNFWVEIPRPNGPGPLLRDHWTKRKVPTPSRSLSSHGPLSFSGKRRW